MRTEKEFERWENKNRELNENIICAKCKKKKPDLEWYRANLCNSEACFLWNLNKYQRWFCEPCWEYRSCYKCDSDTCVFELL